MAALMLATRGMLKLPCTQLQIRRPNSSMCSYCCMPNHPALSASHLQNKFGCPGLQFSASGSFTVAQLSLTTGTTARLLLQDARLTSYRVRMWHGGLEEMLHTDVQLNDEQFVITGGISVLFTLPLVKQCWLVDDVKVDPQDFVQVILRRIDRDGESNSEGRADSQLFLQYVITLSDKGLFSAVVISNKGECPITFTGSISTQLAVSSVKAVSAVGLQGCRFRSLGPIQYEEPSLEVGGWSLMEKLKKFISPNQVVESVGNENSPASDTNELSIEQLSSAQAGDESDWFTEPVSEARFRSGVYKVYSKPPETIRITDEGLARSLVLERLGFENFVLSSPKLEDDKDTFVCIGSASVLDPVMLRPGKTWKAAQVWMPDS